MYVYLHAYIFTCIPPTSVPILPTEVTDDGTITHGCDRFSMINRQCPSFLPYV